MFSAFPSFSKEGLLRRPLSPGTNALDMRRFFPPVIHSRETTGNAEPLSQQFQNISRFDCKHFAIAEKLTQRQTAPLLCKNCGAAQLPVEGKGKMGLLLSARGLGG
jgi:hypothetical protein